MHENVLRLMDGSLHKPEEVLLEEDGVLANTDPFLALKVSLLLPYEQMRCQCLKVVEDDQLKREGIPELSSQSHQEVVLLVIYSGTLSNSSYGSVFSRVPRGADNRSRKQRGYVMFWGSDVPVFCLGACEGGTTDISWVCGDQVHAQSNPSLSLINAAEASLRRYLEKQVEPVDHLEDVFVESTQLETLKNTVSSLRRNSKVVIRSALASLSSCTNIR